MIPKSRRFKTIEYASRGVISGDKRSQKSSKGFSSIKGKRKDLLEIRCFAVNNITDFLFIATKTHVYLYTLNSFKLINTFAY